MKPAIPDGPKAHSGMFPAWPVVVLNYASPVFVDTDIEDACKAHLAEWRGQKGGTYGLTGAFSFQARKQ